MQDGLAKIKLLPLDAKENVFIKATLIVKFRMCEYNIPCAFTENSNGRFKHFDHVVF